MPTPLVEPWSLDCPLCDESEFADYGQLRTHLVQHTPEPRPTLSLPDGLATASTSLWRRLIGEWRARR
eukprot:6822473-Heterocapsa_arctica.AAC.1